MSAGKGVKEKVSGRVDADLLAAVDRYCSATGQTRSDVLVEGLRRVVTPEYFEERERVVAETLDRLVWLVTRLDRHARRELKVLTEMLGLFVRAYYNHTPRTTPASLREFQAAGRERFEAFMAILARNVGPGRSMLEQVPAWAKAREQDHALEEPPRDLTLHDGREAQQRDREDADERSV